MKHVNGNIYIRLLLLSFNDICISTTVSKRHPYNMRKKMPENNFKIRKSAKSTKICLLAHALIWIMRTRFY